MTREASQRGTGTPGETLLDALGPMRLINLAARSDRRREFDAQLRRIGLSLDHTQVRLFRAIRPRDAAGFPSIGARGCFLSHLGVLREARDEGAEGIVVCEDDLDFSPQFPARIAEVTATLETVDWSIFYGGHHLPGDAEIQPLSGGLVQLSPRTAVRTTHFLAVRRPVIAPLVDYLEAILTRAPGDPSGGPMHVDGAFSRFRADHPQFTTLAALPPLGDQRASSTDIHELQWFDKLPLARTAAGIVRKLRRS